MLIVFKPYLSRSISYHWKIIFFKIIFFKINFLSPLQRSCSNTSKRWLSEFTGVPGGLVYCSHVKADWLTWIGDIMWCLQSVREVSVKLSKEILGGCFMNVPFSLWPVSSVSILYMKDPFKLLHSKKALTSHFAMLKKWQHQDTYMSAP